MQIVTFLALKEIIRRNPRILKFP